MMLRQFAKRAGPTESQMPAEALDDMLFTGGRLNVRLLGGADGGSPLCAERAGPNCS
jgi:hypothetical protein